MIAPATRYRVVLEPLGRDYDLLLSFLLTHAATFSLVLTKFTRKSASAMATLEALKPYELDRRETNAWPGTELMPPHTATLHVFRVDEDSVRVLRQLARSLHAWQGPALPDDLSFQRADGTHMLTQTAHEQEAELILTEEERDSLLRAMPELVLDRIRSN